MRNTIIVVSAVVLLAAAWAGECVAAEAVLDTAGQWRIYTVISPPVIDMEGTVQPVAIGPRWLQWTSPSPADGWTATDFDDSTWLRGTVLTTPRTPYVSRLCLRGTFNVSDPKKVADLELSVAYHGGVIVYLNGKEIARRHLSVQAAGDALAEPYPREAYVDDKDSLLNWDRRVRRPGGESGRRIGLRTRVADKVAVPSSLLRPGLNVVAIEAVRAPYHKVIEEKKGQGGNRRMPSDYVLSWATCTIEGVQMRAAKADGLTPSAVRPHGLQVWNGDPLESDFDMDFAGTAEPLRPVEIVGACNGTFSGKLIVGCDEAVRGLKATVSDLAGPGGAVIPSAAVRVRYATAWGSEDGSNGLEFGRYPRPAALLEALEDSPRQEYAVVSREAGRYDRDFSGSPEPVFGAVVPVWLTVRVPADAKPGLYKGRATVSVEGQPPVEATVELTVIDWRVPDAAKWTTWVELFQSPDTLALEYNVPLWSDEHFELIGRSFDLLGEIANPTLYVPLICQTNLGNAESMVRWVPKGDGTYDYDFSIMDRYLDMAEKRIGKPRMVVFNVWDIYVGARKKAQAGGRGGEARALEHLEQQGAELGDGPIVTVADPASKQVRNVELPAFGDAASRKLWKPLCDQLLKRMAKRGLDKSMLLGIITDAQPTKTEVAFFNECLPGVPWVGHSHHGFNHQPNFKLHGIAAVGYETRVWHTYFTSSVDDDKRLYGWKNPVLVAEYNRSRELNQLPPTKWRHIALIDITGSQRGIGRIGADTWEVVKDKRGKRVGFAWSRYPQSNWRNLNLYTSLFAPGPEGPVATGRFEAFREGVQDCEARIAIERALTDKALRVRLGEALAERCQETLDRRALFWWTAQSNLELYGPDYKYATEWRTRAGINGHRFFTGTDWQGRTQELYELAAQVDRKLGAR